MQRSAFAWVAGSRVSLPWTPPFTLMSHGAEFQCKHGSAASVPTQSHKRLARNYSQLWFSVRLTVVLRYRAYFSLPASVCLCQRQQRGLFRVRLLGACWPAAPSLPHIYLAALFCLIAKPHVQTQKSHYGCGKKVWCNGCLLFIAIANPFLPC